MVRQSKEEIDRELLNRLNQGDESAFETIYRKYNAWIYNFANSLLFDKSLTEDLTQNVFLKIWEKHEQINPDDNFESYLFAIARNLIFKETENRLLAERLIESLRSQQSEENNSTEMQIDNESLKEYINVLIEQLPPACRNVYKLSRLQFLSNKEIAEKLSVSEKTVEAQITYSLKFLKKKLANNIGILILMALSFVK
ncbi:RNA polymerase sigma-70 factor [Bacteroidia bacterium]|nr:RNA polymerase sigma-70 factor [Bacteroidia bacterium]GHT59769.1 RNA polymerase sigma-70 factor [Bacteroidia bacterium]